MPTKVTKPTEATRTYLIERSREQIKVTVPDTWRVTFGPVVVGIKKEYGTSSAPVLRFYEGEIARALFTDVESFREVSIPVEKLFVKRKGSAKWEESRSGSSSAKEEVIEEKWEKI